MEPQEYTVLDIIQEIMETERSFHATIRYLNSDTRNQIVAAQLRNTNNAMALVRQFMTIEETAPTMVLNMPLTNNFLDPVPVVPTQVQMTAALEQGAHIPETTCSICQEQTTNGGTRIRHCGHTFHSECIRQWFSVNSRCPMCRVDIRTPLHARRTNTTNENSRLHSDEE